MLGLPAASSQLQLQQIALLNAIARGESGGRYDVRYTPRGGATFNDLSRHPGIFEPGPHGKSSAAGRYQFTKTTWDRMGGGPFTPERQDMMALALAEKDYRARTGRDLWGDIEREGLSPRIQKTLAPTWVALGKSHDKNAAAFNAALGGDGLAQLARPRSNPAVPAHRASLLEPGSINANVTGAACAASMMGRGICGPWGLTPWRRRDRPRALMERSTRCRPRPSGPGPLIDRHSPCAESQRKEKAPLGQNGASERSIAAGKARG